MISECYWRWCQPYGDDEKNSTKLMLFCKKIITNNTFLNMNSSYFNISINHIKYTI